MRPHELRRERHGTGRIAESPEAGARRVLDFGAGAETVRRFLPDLLDLVLARKINPGRVFDLELPLADAADGYRAMDQREAIKVLLRT